jgi:hypothetical protein
LFVSIFIGKLRWSFFHRHFCCFFFQFCSSDRSSLKVLFLHWFFFQFYFFTVGLLEVKLHDFFRWGWFHSHDLGHGFEKFTQVDIGLFRSFLYIDFLFNFIISQWVCWKFDFMTFFTFLSIRLSLSHGLGHGFGELALVDSSLFLGRFS